MGWRDVLGFGQRTFRFIPAALLAGAALPLTAQTGQGDQVAVGSMDYYTYQAFSLLPVPSQTNQKFCTLVRLGPNLLAWAYLPTPAERTGDFSQFPGILVDPATGLPFPGNIIPASQIPTVFAWRIAAAGPGPGEPCLPVPGSYPQFSLMDYVTGQSGEVDPAVGQSVLSFAYTLGDPFPAAQNLNVTASAPAVFAVIPGPFVSNNTTSDIQFSGVPGTPTWLYVAQAQGGFQAPASVPVYVLPNELSPGLYKGLLTVSAIDVLSQPVAVEVDAVVFAPPTWATVDTTILPPFTYLLGSDTLPSSQQIAITGLGAAQSFSIVTHVEDQTGNWLIATPSQGSVPTTVTFSVDPGILSTLQRGTHFAYADIFTPGAPNSPIRIFASLSISPAADFTITPQTLTFAWTPGGSAPAPQQVSLDPAQDFTTDPSSLKFNLVFTPKNAAESAWALSSPNPAGVKQFFQVSLSQTALASLPTGVHSGWISLNSPDATGQITAGTIPVTLTVGPGSAAANVTQVISQVADGEGWQTTITLVNSDTVNAAPVTLHFWPGSETSAATGLSLAGRGPLTDMTVNDVVPAGGSLTLKTAGSTGPPLWQGWGELTSPASVGGTAVFHTQISTSQDSEAAVPVKLADGTRFVLPFDDTQGFVTTMALVNPSPDQSVTVTVTFLDETGSPITVPSSQSSFPMTPRKQDTFRLKDRFTGIAGRQGVAEFVSSGGQIAGLGLRFNPRLSFTSFEPLISNSGAASQRVTHVADGDGWQTSIRLVNLDLLNQAGFTLQFYPGQDTPPGSPLNLNGATLVNNRMTGIIPRGGSYTVTTQGTGAALWQGWAQVTATTSVGGLAIFKDFVSDTQDAEGAVPLNAAGSNRFLVPFDNTAGFETGVAIVNPDGTRQASITAAFRNSSGEAILSPNVYPMKAAEHQAFSLAPRFGLEGQTGVADFSSSLADLFGIGLRFNPRYAFTSVPILRK